MKTKYEEHLEKEARMEQMRLDELRRKDLSVRCAKYIRKPCSKMTNEQAMAFASMQAESARETIPMTDEEAKMYAGAIYSSIRYFNDRDPEHAAYIRYLEECEKEAETKALQKKNTEDEGSHLDVFFY